MDKHTHTHHAYSVYHIVNIMWITYLEITLNLDVWLCLLCMYEKALCKRN